MIQIPLTRGYVAIVDDEDAWVLDFKWYAYSPPSGGFVYALRNASLCRGEIRGTSFRMHRVILDVTDPKIHVDHADGDGLNNRRRNIRAVTASENLHNVAGAPSTSTSGLLGVSWDRFRNKWRAYVETDGIRKWLGRFNTIEEANATRLAAEKTLWGVTPRRAWAHATDDGA